MAAFDQILDGCGEFERKRALLDDLERFVHEPPGTPPLVQAALLHYQFETIHPFLAVLTAET